MKRDLVLSRRLPLFTAILIFALGPLFGANASAHPLGNFTVNQFARVEASATAVTVHGVVDMAEIPTFQELATIDADRDGTPSARELAAYAVATAAGVAANYAVRIDGQAVTLAVERAAAELRPGVGGMQTLRVTFDVKGNVPAAAASGTRHVEFETRAYADRIGWREIVVGPGPGASVFDSSAFGTSATHELEAYPQDGLAAPLDERRAAFTVTTEAVPPSARPLLERDGKELVRTRDPLADLIALPTLTPLTALLGLLLAAGLGGMHAMSPGHGKAIVGAYLVGSRGTPRHAVLLGATVTVTHTAGVFALGLITLFASHYILPERLFPILGFASGAIVVVMGLTLLVQRLRSLLRGAPHGHAHPHDHGDGEHSHGGRVHSHLPPGVDGQPITMRGLLALGVSGGLLPCPSALVVMLSAISLERVGYGLLLVVAFSLGLAGVLTSVGLVFLYAGRLLKSRVRSSERIAAVLSVCSAFAIACVGIVITAGALTQWGVDLGAIAGGLQKAAAEPSFAGAGAFGILGLGLVFGLKHATEADHVVAVSTIVSEHRKLARAAIVGGLWGIGHTASLVVVGTVVLALRIAIPESVAGGLEFLVALMIIALGCMALWRGLRNRSDVHVHRHEHDGVSHAHIHFHEGAAPSNDAPHPSRHSHAVTRIGIKPIVVGAVHGLAGSAALTLLVLTQIQSTLLGLLYLAVFGLGSIGGMMLMSGLVGLPFTLTSNRLGRFHHGLQIVAGAFSILFGIWYAFETSMSSGLIGSILR